MTIDLDRWREYPDHYWRSIWPAKLPHKPVGYGTPDFHGRTHPDIAFVAIDRYLPEGGLVWDCMAGGGTVMDVCGELGVECVSTDLKPLRPGIIEADAREYDLDGRKADLVFFHPPYMDTIDFGTGQNTESGNLYYWTEANGQVIINIARQQEPGAYLVVIVGSVYAKVNRVKQLIPLEYGLMQYLWGRYHLRGRVIRPFGETKARGNQTGLWKYRSLRFGLWHLDQDSVLFLERSDKDPVGSGWEL